MTNEERTLEEFIFRESFKGDKVDYTDTCQKTAWGKCPLKVKLAAEKLMGHPIFPSDVMDYISKGLEEAEKEFVDEFLFK